MNMQLSLNTQSPAVAARKALRCPAQGRVRVVMGAKKSLDGKGFITKDNSGRENIFPTSSKAFYSSPRTAAVASSGLGGAQGAGVIAAALVIVAIATAGVVGKQPDETLAQVNNAYQGEALSVVAGRIEKSL